MRSMQVIDILDLLKTAVPYLVAGKLYLLIAMLDAKEHVSYSI